MLQRIQTDKAGQGSARLYAVVSLGKIHAGPYSSSALMEGRPKEGESEKSRRKNKLREKNARAAQLFSADEALTQAKAARCGGPGTALPRACSLGGARPPHPPRSPCASCAPWGVCPVPGRSWRGPGHSLTLGSP